MPIAKERRRWRRSSPMSKPPVRMVSAVMKAIQKKVGFGDVRVTLAGDQFYAHAFPSREAAQQQFLDSDRSTDFVEFVEQCMATSVAYGIGRTAEDALNNLDAKLH